MPWKPDYVSADEVAAFARVDDDVDDEQYALFASMASRAVDNATNRQFGLTTSQARFYVPRWSFKRAAWVVETDDFVTVTEVAVDALGTGIWEVLDIAVLGKLPVNAAVKERPFERITIRGTLVPAFSYTEESVRVTGTFGWAAVPEEVKGATLLQASRFAARRDSPYGIAGSPESGTEMRLQAKADPDVKVALKDFVRRNLP